MCVVNGNVIREVYGELNTPMYFKAVDCVNPCMAMATCWGEAGCSYPGISLTQLMDFQPSTYSDNIDWLNLSANLGQVDEYWYYTHAANNTNVNEEGKAYGMPVALLQYTSSTPRSAYDYVQLGVGPYQVTSSDWEGWPITKRVSPIEGWRATLSKCGNNYLRMDVDPISDLTVYAAMSLSHQGGALVTYDFGKRLINVINTQSVQDAINQAGYMMYQDACEMSLSKKISLSDLDVSKYSNYVCTTTGINFSSYTGGPGPTNKGMYTLNHCVRYVFYKYYFTGGLD